MVEWVSDWLKVSTYRSKCAAGTVAGAMLLIDLAVLLDLTWRLLFLVCSFGRGLFRL